MGVEELAHGVSLTAHLTESFCHRVKRIDIGAGQAVALRPMWPATMFAENRLNLGKWLAPKFLPSVLRQNREKFRSAGLRYNLIKFLLPMGLAYLPEKQPFIMAMTSNSTTKKATFWPAICHCPFVIKPETP